MDYKMLSALFIIEPLSLPNQREPYKAINMHSRGPTEQYFYVSEPHRGCLHKVKKVRWYPLIKKGQQSRKCAF